MMEHALMEVDDRPTTPRPTRKRDAVNAEAVDAERGHRAQRPRNAEAGGNACWGRVTIRLAREEREAGTGQCTFVGMGRRTLCKG